MILYTQPTSFQLVQKGVHIYIYKQALKVRSDEQVPRGDEEREGEIQGTNREGLSVLPQYGVVLDQEGDGFHEVGKSQSEAVQPMVGGAKSEGKSMFSCFDDAKKIPGDVNYGGGVYSRYG